ncbi:MAG: hypothetical protein OXH99_11755 [Bryobacterales bacterium]|nr:hypothetical protein [Bryobacterales bacterium]
MRSPSGAAWSLKGSEALADVGARLQRNADAVDLWLFVAEIGRNRPAMQPCRFTIRKIPFRWRQASAGRPDGQAALTERIRRRNQRRAIREIWSWAQSFVPGALPRYGWQRRWFEDSYANATCRAYWNRSKLLSTWSFHLRTLDEKRPRESWNLEAAVHRQVGSTPTLSVRTFCETAERRNEDRDTRLELPSFIRAIADRTGLRIGNADMSATPTVVRSDADVRGLADGLLDNGRRHTAIVFLSPDGDETSRLRPGSVARGTVGLAKVFVVPPDAARSLSARLGCDITADGWGVRVFSPGFSASDRTEFFPAQDLFAERQARNARRWLEAFLAADNIEQFRLGTDVREFDIGQFRRAERRAKSKTARRKRASKSRADRAAPSPPILPDTQTAQAPWLEFVRSIPGWVMIGRRKKQMEQQLRDKDAEIQRYKKELSEAKAEAQWLSDEHDKAETEAKRLRERLDGIEPRLEEYRRRLQDRGENPDIPLPDTWESFYEWHLEHLTDKLLLSQRAVREIKSTRFKDVELAAKGLVWLATKYRKSRIGGRGENLRGACGSGLANQPCGGDTFLFKWADKRIPVKWHVKGTNTRDPERCLRIYYFWDARNQQVVVASMPGHV